MNETRPWLDDLTEVWGLPDVSRSQSGGAMNMTIYQWPQGKVAMVYGFTEEVAPRQVWRMRAQHLGPQGPPGAVILHTGAFPGDDAVRALLGALGWPVGQRDVERATATEAVNFLWDAAVNHGHEDGFAMAMRWAVTALVRHFGITHPDDDRRPTDG